MVRLQQNYSELQQNYNAVNSITIQLQQNSGTVTTELLYSNNRISYNKINTVTTESQYGYNRNYSIAITQLQLQQLIQLHQNHNRVTT